MTSRAVSSRRMAIACAVSLLASPSAAQQPSLQDALLDDLQGRWIIRGTIAGAKTVHDLTADWILDHHYLRLHEISRERRQDGRPKYEAVVHIGWNPTTNTYGCVWLDDYGGLNTQSVGAAARKGSEIPFVFTNVDGTFTRTTMTYDDKGRRWTWKIEEDRWGKLSPFADLILSRR